ncbi:hypothetical protein DFH08DRAFT_1071347 [Mycena albidolilacea]|uniref:Uncharacterized protein n=1 Tax=Mycena albidolilacea TaxID=1033008 RepID=A0AAD7AVC5_9AGAR|nr:hypothetical protein DFH08DRAFT_1071347 [Mycena albidolilacea]
MFDPQLRSSIYYLTSALAYLQRKHPSINNIDNDNARTASRADSLLAAQSRAASHLATLFARGLPAESSRNQVVAVTTAPDQVDTWIISESKADSSISSTELSSQTESSSNDPDLIISQNSDTAEGQFWKGSVHAGTSETFEKQLHQYADLAVVYEVTFDKYVPDLLAALRLAGTLRLDPDIDRAAKAQRSLLYFVTRNCLPKIEDRLHSISRSFKMTELAGWNSENLKLMVPFKISEDLHTSIIESVPDPFVKLSGAGGYLYSNPQDNNTWAAADAKAWWGQLVEIVLLLEMAVVHTDLDGVVQLSGIAHRMLRATPASLWNCVSLDAHIKSTMMTKTVESEKDANAGSSNKNEITITTTDDDDDDDEEASEIVFSGLPYSLLFARKVEAACASITAARQLYRSKIAASGMGFAYRILQLPRTSVAEYSTTEIISRWHTRGNWPAASTKALEDLKKWMEKAKMQTSKGAMHCEAGILAALFATEAEADRTPKIVKQALNSLQLASASTPIPIGIAKKCCPACAILAKLVGKTKQIDVVGKHSRWHAWVPPEWLPATVMVELEMKFLEVLQSMVADPWAASAASSPTSTIGGSPPLDQYKINKDVKDLEAKLTT